MTQHYTQDHPENDWEETEPAEPCPTTLRSADQIVPGAPWSNLSIPVVN